MRAKNAKDTIDQGDQSIQVEQGSSLWRDAWQRLQKNKLALLGLVILSLMILTALLTPWIAPYSYEEQNLALGASATLLAALAGHRCLWPGYVDAYYVRRAGIADGGSYRHGGGFDNWCRLRLGGGLCGW